MSKYNLSRPNSTYLTDHTQPAEAYENQIEVADESEVGRYQDPFGCSAMVNVMTHDKISI